MAHPPLSADVLAPWLEERFDRAAGPGGQNVNKLSTRVTLLLNFQACPLFSPTQRARIAQHLATRLSHDGRLRVVAQESRTQRVNRRTAGERLVALLTAALHVPRVRRPTRPTAGAQRRRLAAKRRRGATKRDRRGGGEEGPE